LDCFVAPLLATTREASILVAVEEGGSEFGLAALLTRPAVAAFAARTAATALNVRNGVDRGG